MDKQRLEGFLDAVKLIKYSIIGLENVEQVQEIVKRIEAAAEEGKIEKLKEELLLF